jgi:hypothetical protein
MNANGTYVPINQVQNNLMMNPYAMNQMYNAAGSSGMSRAVSDRISGVNIENKKLKSSSCRINRL